MVKHYSFAVNPFHLPKTTLVLLRANAVVVPVNPMNRAEELKHYIVDPDAKVAITSADLVSGYSGMLKRKRQVEIMSSKSSS